jgi:hypothetical protein
MRNIVTGKKIGPHEAKTEEIRNQHLGFAASMTSTLPHFKIFLMNL